MSLEGASQSIALYRAERVGGINDGLMVRVVSVNRCGPVITARIHFQIVIGGVGGVVQRQKLAGGMCTIAVPKAF
ncbi:hypothetical protein C2E31_15510 [Rhodopirellula baltica]|nr:hypothetical protein C2E31_15510 [Rhodopirellula baltica]